MAASSGFRLIRMLDAIPGKAARETSSLKKILRLAAGDVAERKKIKWNEDRSLLLYVSVPTDQVAWGHRTKEAVSNTSARPGQLIASVREQMLGNLVPVPQIDVRFLQLSLKDIGALKSSTHVRIHWFPSGLQLADPWANPDLQDRFIAADVSPQLCLRPHAFGMSSISPFDAPKLFNDPAFEIEIKIDDVYLKEPDALLLCRAYGLPPPNLDSLSTLGTKAATPLADGDPLHLKGHVDGVYDLYQLAKACYGDRLKKRPLRKEVIERLHEQNRKLFSISDRDGQAAKFINPKHKLGQGNHDGQPREFKEIATNILRYECGWRDPLVISESLALIIVAAKKWLNWHINAPPGNKSIPLALIDELRSYGFTKEIELAAILAFITWDGKDFMSLRSLNAPVKPRRPPESA